MIEILIAIIAFTALSTWGSKGNNFNSFFQCVLCPFAAVFGFMFLTVYAFVAWEYFAAGYKADLINKEFGTQYTQEQFFYASDMINEVRELKRKCIDINGDLMNGKKP